MISVSWQAAWRASFENDMAPKLGIPAIHAKYPTEIEERTTKTTMPGSTVETAFWYVIDIGCVDPDHPYVRDFLAWTIEMGETILNDTTRWETRWAVSRRVQRSLLTGVLALAYGIRDDIVPDAALLNASRLDAMETYDAAKGSHWDDSTQSHHLRSVQFCLIEGDVSLAAQMLRGKRQFVWPAQWHDWLIQFIGNLEVEGGQLTGADSIAAFDSLFDRVRNPKYAPRQEKGYDMLISRSLLRLQLAILRHKYIDGGPIAGRWRQILQSIAA